jgi:hypothetical protein
MTRVPFPPSPLCRRRCIPPGGTADMQEHSRRDEKGNVGQARKKASRHMPIQMALRTGMSERRRGYRIDQKYSASSPMSISLIIRGSGKP